VTCSQAELKAWMRATADKERWFVDPPRHVAKAEGAVAIGMLSHFTYAFSMMALGNLSLYHQINRDADCPGIADRIFVYDPLADENGHLVPDCAPDAALMTFERHIPLHELQLICVSLTNADAVTTALNLMRLGGIPLRCDERRGGPYPLILAGGPGCGNPEPFADFFDLFCIGDGRKLTTQVVKALHALRANGETPSGEAVHAMIPDAGGLYVPALYSFSYAGSRVVAIHAGIGPERVAPATDPAEEWAQASLVTGGDTAVIVPNQGCKHRCAYCQISEIKYRQFEIDPLLERVDQYLEQGVSTLIVNSATLTQHGDVERLLGGIADRVDRCGWPVDVYIGSVRFDEVSESILRQLGRLKAFSHTYLLYTNGERAKYMALAPEHGSRDLMRRLHRPVDPWRILDTVDLAMRQGVHNYVLYFIVGFDSECAADRDQISALSAALLDKIHPHRGKAILKINPLIPTPGTACQRMAMPDMEAYRGYLDEVAEGIRARIGADRYDAQVELVALPEDRLLVEAIINRADRRIGPLLERLADDRAGGRNPSGETLKAWTAACGLSWQDLTGARGETETLPWQVVDATWQKAEQDVLRGVRERIMGAA
jgi:radical SAM superfamily enzyme YgiQ (UPF0313 family)